MTEFCQLSANERLEALAQAADASGRPPHLLEKDIWVVWALRHPVTSGTGYVPSAVMLEFGARSTGEPFDLRPVFAVPPSTCKAWPSPKRCPR